jgi:hypothetical protein
MRGKGLHLLKSILEGKIKLWESMPLASPSVASAALPLATPLPQPRRSLSG